MFNVLADAYTAWPLSDAALSQEILDLVQQASHYREHAFFSRISQGKHTPSRKRYRQLCAPLNLCRVMHTLPWNEEADSEIAQAN